jgi:hypothetical protein
MLTDSSSGRKPISRRAELSTGEGTVSASGRQLGNGFEPIITVLRQCGGDGGRASATHHDTAPVGVGPTQRRPGTSAGAAMGPA